MPPTSSKSRSKSGKDLGNTNGNKVPSVSVAPTELKDEMQFDGSVLIPNQKCDREMFNTLSSGFDFVAEYCFLFATITTPTPTPIPATTTTTTTTTTVLLLLLVLLLQLRLWSLRLLFKGLRGFGFRNEFAKRSVHLSWMVSWIFHSKPSMIFPIINTL